MRDSPSLDAPTDSLPTSNSRPAFFQVVSTLDSEHFKTRSPLSRFRTIRGPGLFATNKKPKWATRAVDTPFSRPFFPSLLLKHVDNGNLGVGRAYSSIRAVASAFVTVDSALHAGFVARAASWLAAACEKMKTKMKEEP
jgi:hypothetical protein